MSEWPRNWAELTRGVGCEMCENGRPDADRYGVRIHSAPFTDAYLQRADVQRGYTIVIWRGRHVNEPTELDDAEAAGYWAGVLTVARALISVYHPLKMNYETLGNSLPTCTPTWFPGSPKIHGQVSRSPCPPSSRMRKSRRNSFGPRHQHFANFLTTLRLSLRLQGCTFGAPRPAPWARLRKLARAPGSELSGEMTGHPWPNRRGLAVAGGSFARALRAVALRARRLPRTAADSHDNQCHGRHLAGRRPG